MRLWLLILLASVTSCLAQDGGQANAAGSWDPRNLVTKGGVVAYYDPGNRSTLASNPAGAAAGSGVSWLSNRVDSASTNTHLVQGTASAQPLLSRIDNAGNLCKYSDDLTQAPWAATAATKTSATELTFTGQNGQVIQNVATPSGVSFTFSFYARTNVPGNVNLTILHSNSASSNSTPVTLTGTLTKYSVTVLGKTGAGGDVSFGIQDTNAAGFGSIILSNMQVRVSTWDSTYVATAANPIFVGLRGRSVIYCDGAAHYLKSAAFTLNQPEEIYMGLMQWTWTVNDYIFDGLTAHGMMLFQHTTSPRIGNYDASNRTPYTTNLPLGAWGVVRNGFSGANTYIQINNNAASTGTQTNNAGGFSVGAKADGGGAGNILVSKFIICNKTNAAPEASYLKWGLLKDAGAL